MDQEQAATGVGGSYRQLRSRRILTAPLIVTPAATGRRPSSDSSASPSSISYTDSGDDESAETTSEQEAGDEATPAPPESPRWRVWWVIALVATIALASAALSVFFLLPPQYPTPPLSLDFHLFQTTRAISDLMSHTRQYATTPHCRREYDAHEQSDLETIWNAIISSCASFGLAGFGLHLAGVRDLPLERYRDGFDSGQVIWDPDIADLLCDAEKQATTCHDREEDSGRPGSSTMAYRIQPSCHAIPQHENLSNPKLRRYGTLVPPHVELSSALERFFWTVSELEVKRDLLPALQKAIIALSSFPTSSASSTSPSVPAAMFRLSAKLIRSHAAIQAELLDIRDLFDTFADALDRTALRAHRRAAVALACVLGGRADLGSRITDTAIRLWREVVLEGVGSSDSVACGLTDCTTAGVGDGDGDEAGTAQWWPWGDRPAAPCVCDGCWVFRVASQGRWPDRLPDSRASRCGCVQTGEDQLRGKSTPTAASSSRRRPQTPDARPSAHDFTSFSLWRHCSSPRFASPEHERAWNTAIAVPVDHSVHTPSPFQTSGPFTEDAAEDPHQLFPALAEDCGPLVLPTLLDEWLGQITDGCARNPENLQTLASVVDDMITLRYEDDAGSHKSQIFNHLDEMFLATANIERQAAQFRNRIGAWIDEATEILNTAEKTLHGNGYATEGEGGRGGRGLIGELVVNNARGHLSAAWQPWRCFLQRVWSAVWDRVDGSGHPSCTRWDWCTAGGIGTPEGTPDSRGFKIQPCWGWISDMVAEMQAKRRFEYRGQGERG